MNRGAKHGTGARFADRDGEIMAECAGAFHAEIGRIASKRGMEGIRGDLKRRVLARRGRRIGRG